MNDVRSLCSSMISFADFQFVQIDQNLRSIDQRILRNPSISFGFQRRSARKDFSHLPIRIARPDSSHLQTCSLSRSIRIRIFVSLVFSTSFAKNVFCRGSIGMPRVRCVGTSYQSDRATIEMVLLRLFSFGTEILRDVEKKKHFDLFFFFFFFME